MMTLSPTLVTIARMSWSDAAYWGSEVYAAVGPRVYAAVQDLTSIPRTLIAALGTGSTNLQFADDLRPQYCGFKKCARTYDHKRHYWNGAICPNTLAQHDFDPA